MLLFLLLVIRFCFKSEIGIHWHRSIKLKSWEKLLSSIATIFASTNFPMVRTKPWFLALQMFDNIFFENEDEAIEAKFLLTGSSHIIAVTLISNFVPRLAHVTVSHLHKRNWGQFVESWGLGPLHGLFWGWVVVLGYWLHSFYYWNGSINRDQNIKNQIIYYSRKSSLFSWTIYSRWLP